MTGHYGAARAGSIAALWLCAVLAAGLATAADRPLVCVLVPHFKDEYWLSVGYGIEREAARADAQVVFHEAGGYRALDRQVAQVAECEARGADAILIGAVDSDYPAMTDAIARAARETPVFGLVNALDSDALSARIGVDWRDMGRAVGRYLAARHPAGTPPRTAVVVSGPPEAAWSVLLEAGLREGLAESAVAIADSFGADTGLRQQLGAVEDALARHPEADYLIGSAPAIEAAMGLFAARPEDDRPGLLATYISHAVLRGLGNGRVLAAPFDDPIRQGVVAMRRALGKDGEPGPGIVLLEAGDAGRGPRRLAPAEYFPTLD
ncbi:TMAO reductase system periplasmic protein TorT [Palleronia sediminis]|nr:TMAO reductase system periplasmic protein TorT [Palleronia sediminis]